MCKIKVEYMPENGHLIPALKLPGEARSIGFWGGLRRDYLKNHRPGTYTCMVLNGSLWTYLADLNEQAETRLEVIARQMAAAEGITEELKAREPFAWIQQMNNLRARAAEIVREELIFV